MILKQLKLIDFGVFSGEHTLDLVPRQKDGQKRPIILFGGLNGAGKTTTLTAVRLALYGRQSLGLNLPVGEYHAQLEDLIHRPKDALLTPYSSTIELDFTYGKHGSLHEYRVIRSWLTNNGKVSEQLAIKKDGELLEGLSNDQLQSFLNELIPIGVADLFFFDGEKIAELAEDDGNHALADAIKRLLGLNIIDRLRADLGIYLREHTKNELPAELSQKLQAAEQDYKDSYDVYQGFLSAKNDLKTLLTAVETDISAVKQKLGDLGGAWAQSREAEELRSEQCIKERNAATVEMRELMADALPLAMAPNTLGKLLDQLTAEKETKSRQKARSEVDQYLKILQEKMQQSLSDQDQQAAGQLIDETFSPLLNTDSDAEIIHDISDSEYEQLSGLINSYVPQQVTQFKKLANKVEQLEDELANAAENIARAPEQERLNDVLEELEALQVRKGGLEKEINTATDGAKRGLREAMDSLRTLRDLDEKYRKSMSQNQATELATNSRTMLAEFGEETKKRKLAILEQEFIKSFSKLARKDDMDIQAHINPETFSVSLTNSHGNTINKKKLSAGEKQIYAIAMLEALGRTSGRNLPIIIDTPLGRLDSKHRSKLVTNYFPTASHQVIILSTDTEIDEDFYAELTPEISHAYSVDYDANKGCSQFNEGYFWLENAS